MWLAAKHLTEKQQTHTGRKDHSKQRKTNTAQTHIGVTLVHKHLDNVTGTDTQAGKY